MTSHVGRVYAVALALVVFFLAWAVVAARPWLTPAADPRLDALRSREARLERTAALVRELASQRASGRPRAAVRVVELPPLTVTRSS